MTEPTRDRMLGTAEVCEQLGIGRSKLNALIRSGELEAINLNPGSPKRRVGERGRRPSYRIAQSAVDAFIERARVDVPA